MTPLEQRLADELRDEAANVREKPGLAGNVIRAARRRRQRQVAVSAGIMAAAAVAVGVIVSGGTRPSAGPPADHPTPAPTNSRSGPALPDPLRSLPPDGPVLVDWALGNVLHRGSGQITLPDGWRVTRLTSAGDGRVVEAMTRGGRVVALVSPDGTVTELSKDAPSGVAVDPTGTLVAWGSAHDVASSERVTVVRLRTRKVVRTVDTDQPTMVQAWVPGQGPIFSRAADPHDASTSVGGAPVVLDLATGRLRPAWAGGAGQGEPRFMAYSSATRTMAVSMDGCLAYAGPAAPSRGGSECLLTASPAAFADSPLDGERLAVTTGDRLLVLLDGTIEDENPVPAGTVPVQQVWEHGASRLVVVADGGTGGAAPATHVLRCVGSGLCARAYDSAPGETVVLLQP